MTPREKQSKFAFNISLLIQFAFKSGFELTFGEVARPMSQVLLNYFGYDIVNNNGQLVLVKRSPTSKTLTSRHLDKLAADFNIFKDGVMLFKPGQSKEELIKDLQTVKPLGDYWVSLNTDNVWGGDFNRNSDVLDDSFHDPYHFEMKP